MLQQSEVPVRKAAFFEGEAMYTRLRILSQLASLQRYQVLMVDTDVCFFSNPFPWLERQRRTLILEGGRVYDFNLGTVYADSRRKVADLELLHSVASRYDELKAAFLAWRSGRRYIDSGVAWDQGVFADALMDWVLPQPHMSLTCSYSGAASACFWRCCEPGALGVAADLLANRTAVYRALHTARERAARRLVRSRTILATNFSCSRQTGIAHRNVCPLPDYSMGQGRRRANPLPTHLDWLRVYCWHAPLTALAARWQVRHLWDDDALT